MTGLPQGQRLTLETGNRWVGWTVQGIGDRAWMMEGKQRVDYSIKHHEQYARLMGSRAELFSASWALSATELEGLALDSALEFSLRSS